MINGNNIKFQTNKEVEDLTDGYFITLLKYGALIILTWLFVSFVLFMILGQYDLIPFVNTFILETSIVLAVVGFYSYKIYNKFLFGRLYTLQINYIKKKVIIKSVNTINGRIIINKVPFKDFTFSSKVNDSLFLGKQRVVTFLNNKKLVVKVNLELTEWGKLKHSPEMFKKLNELKF